MAESLQYQYYESKCRQLTLEKEIRFAGIIDEKGNLVAGGFKEGISPFEGDETKLSEFMQFASRVSLRKEFDKELGPINYLAARRDRIVLISFPFPVSNFILLISAEPTVDIEKIAKNIMDIFRE
jgi:hypothetical protein